jgi:hypothetical protein
MRWIRFDFIGEARQESNRRERIIMALYQIPAGSKRKAHVLPAMAGRRCITCLAGVVDVLWPEKRLFRRHYLNKYLRCSMIGFWDPHGWRQCTTQNGGQSVENFESSSENVKLVRQTLYAISWTRLLFGTAKG